MNSSQNFTSSVGLADRQNSRSTALEHPPVGLQGDPAHSRDSSSTLATQDCFSSIIEQHDAFTILKGRTDQDIWNYVNLSDEELTAIIKLRLWIRSTSNNNNNHDSTRSSFQSSLARCSNVSSLSTSSRGRTSSNSVARSSVTSTESISSNYQPVGEKTLRRPFGSQATVFELALEEDGTLPNIKSQCSYWCTVCEPARRFQTSGGWIKHEKERHEKTVFVCMPDGPTSKSEHGRICVLCGARDPSAKHLEEHNIAPCLNRAVTARTYTRLYQLQKHLETHKVPKGSSCAGRWRRGCSKQAWACGFCVAYFASAKERFHHIATEHYERGEDISKWDPSKVVLGLLQQPKVHKAWTERLKLQFSAGQIDLRWDKTPSRSLITMLELGVRGAEDGTDLATAAFIQSDYYQRLLDGRLTAINPIQGAERGMHGSPGLGPLGHHSQNFEQQSFPNPVNRTMDSNSARPEWPHPSGHHSSQAVDVPLVQHREAFAEPPTLDSPQMIDSSLSAKLEMFGPISYEIPTIEIPRPSHPEQSTWPAPILFGDEYPPRHEPRTTRSSRSYVPASLFGEFVGGQLRHAPIGDPEVEQKLDQESERVNSRESISPSSQNKRLVSKYSTHRSASPMDVDLDTETFGIMGNEETILEAQINLWDQHMFQS
ncbi:hypothetical protein MMC07_002126 [Pseudocyphellaria aurata]|nr:hypothetical protein [Pseudocyphellaria aurata]